MESTEGSIPSAAITEKTIPPPTISLEQLNLAPISVPRRIINVRPNPKPAPTSTTAVPKKIGQKITSAWQPNTLNQKKLMQAKQAQREKINKSILQACKKYGVKYKELHGVMMCESSGRPSAHNTKEKHGESIGILQFRRETFYENARAAGIINPNVWDPYQQIRVAAHMFNKGMKKRWSCARKLGLCGG